MDARHLSPEELNERRRRAVELRLAGRPVAEVARTVELSAPTVIAAHRAYLARGWEGVAVRPRGRRAGSGRQIPAEVEQRLLGAMTGALPEALGLAFPLWCDDAVGAWLERETGRAPPRRSLHRYRSGWGIHVPDPETAGRDDPEFRRWLTAELRPLRRLAGPGHALLWTGLLSRENAGAGPGWLLYARSARGDFVWQGLSAPARAQEIIAFWQRLLAPLHGRPVLVALGFRPDSSPELLEWLGSHESGVLWTQAPTTVPHPPIRRPSHDTVQSPAPAHAADSRSQSMTAATTADPGIAQPAVNRPDTLTHLQRLEAESIHILREVVAEAENPVMLYSIGKDSSVMLHLAVKAFYPARPPFPLLHVDTTWKFRAMYEFRDRMASRSGMDLIVHINQDGIGRGINPFTHGSSIYTDVMKTEGLKQALEKYGFDVAFGGARRDEEKSRAKERIFSFRTAQHRWDPKNQRPELWSLYNARKHRGESIRVFPLSNWTELDIWQYIYLENIPIVPLYFAAPRPVVERDGTLIMVDDERFPLKPGEVPAVRKVRFRTLGCYPLSGAIPSEANTLEAIIQEMLLARTSERQGRLIDHDSAASMERKKQEGYF